jgi:hypothetical protein
MANVSWLNVLAVEAATPVTVVLNWKGRRWAPSALPMEWKLRTRVLWILAVSALVPVVLVAVVVGFLAIAPWQQDYSHHDRFDSATWAAAAREPWSEWPTRLRMVDDLVESKRLDGLPRADVVSLLGPADRTDKWSDWDLVYWLGPERGFIRIDSEWLVLRFNESGRVREYRVVRD